MKMGVSFTILTLLLLSLTIHCQVSRITLNPTTLTLTNNQIYGTVVITCQPPADASIQSLLTLGIKRNTSSLVDQSVGLYKLGDSAPTGNPSIIGATITGGGSSNSITVTMSQASCMDAGVYRCDAVYIDPQNTIHPTFSSDNLTVNASPGTINLTADPLQPSYSNGSNLILRCNGFIGSEEVQWVWQYKDPGVGWSAYIPQSENDITTDPPYSISNSCQRTQESRLSRVITTDDDGRTYRCYVRRGNFIFDQNAPEYLIQNVASQGQTPAPSSSKGSQRESATLTIVPYSLSISNATGSVVSVTVKCSPPATFDTLISLTISRNLTSNPNVPISMAAVTTRNTEAQMLTPIPGASASGSLAENFVQVTMTQVSCNDAGTYRCTAYYFVVDSGVPEPSTADKNFTVQVLPGQITLTALPQYTYYEPETILEMTCNGQVGSTTSGTQISWVWEYQDYQSFTWNQYMPESDITPPSPPLTENKCQNNQVSVLTRRITLDDDKRTYRCYVRRGGQSFTNLAGTYQIGTVSYGDRTPSPSTGTDRTSSPNAGTERTPSPNTGTETSCLNDFNRGLALGIGCTLAVVIVIVIIALMWMLRLKWVLPCAKNVTNKPDKIVRTFSPMVNHGSTKESQTCYGLGNDHTYDELKINEIGQAAPYSYAVHRNN